MSGRIEMVRASKASDGGGRRQAYHSQATFCKQFDNLLINIDDPDSINPFNYFRHYNKF